MDIIYKYKTLIIQAISQRILPFLAIGVLMRSTFILTYYLFNPLRRICLNQHLKIEQTTSFSQNDFTKKLDIYNGCSRIIPRCLIMIR